MLRFISKPNAVRRIHRFFSDTDFVSRVLRFKLQDIETSQLNSDIKSLSSAESFLATQNKLFLQISGSLPLADLEASKAAYIYRAAEVFSKPTAWGEAGESLRQFVAKMYASGSFTPELTRHFVEQTFVTLVRDGLHRDLSSMTMDVYVSILENCVLNDDMSSNEIQACTKYALEKLQFTQKKSKFIGRLVVAHALFLKKQKGRSTETDYGNALDSLLQLVNYTVKYLPNMPTQDILGSVLLISHVNSCAEVFQGLSRMSVFATNWQLLDLEFQKTFRKNADFIDQYVKTAPEETLLAFLEEANSIANLYLPEQSKSILQSAVLERLESNSRNTTSNLVAMLISFCFKLDKNFEVSPKYLGALRVSTSDPVMQALQNASTNLDIFSKNQLADHLMIFIQELEVYLIRLMNGEEARESAHQAKLLAGIFKQLVALNRGNINLFKAFFEYFSHQKVLDSIGLMPVLVQLLPALGIKTKKFGGAMTMNNSEDQMQNTMSLATTVSAEIKPSMKNVWKGLDEFLCKKLLHIDLENLPAIMIQFVYGQIATSDLKIFNEITDRLKGNMGRLTAKQLAQSVYTLVRTNLPQIGDVTNEAVAAFHQKTKLKSQEYSQERVTVLWSASKSANLDFSIYEQMLKTEIINIEKYNDRVFVQLINSIGVLSPNLELKTLQDLLEQISKFLEKKGKTFSLQVILGCAYHLLMFPQHAELQSLYNTIFNEISHLVGSQQKFMNQSFLLIYYTYLVLCHRKARGAPMPEINRYNGIVGKYQIEILKNYAAAKKGVVSSSESFFKDLVTKNYGQLGISEIEEEPNRVMECGSMNFLLLPAAKVAGMIEKQQSLKDFPTKCLLVPYSIDILADDYAFEINGPFHYARDCITQKFHLNGHTKLKKEFIQSLGLKYVEVPFWVIDEMITIDDKDKLAKVKELLQTDVNGSDK